MKIVFLSCGLGLAAVACQSTGGAPPPAEPAPAPVPAAADAEPVADAAPPPRDDQQPADPATRDPKVVQAFWSEAIAECNDYLVSTGNETEGTKRFDGSDRDPSRAITVGARQPNGSVVVTDAAGTQLWVDAAANRITPVGGEAEAMPVAYAFCDPKTWVGTMHD